MVISNTLIRDLLVLGGRNAGMQYMGSARLFASGTGKYSEGVLIEF